MTGVIRINGQSISVPTYIVEACKDPENDLQTKVFLDQVREATRKPDIAEYIKQYAEANNGLLSILELISANGSKL